MDTSQAPLFFILNAAAGSQHAEATIAAIKNGMAGSNREYRLITLESGDTKRRIRAVVEEVCTAEAIVVAAGGDGTISGVAQQLVNRPCPLGVLPQGTFNFFARSLGMAEETEEAVRQLLQSRPRPIQAGMVNGRLFLVNASLGLHPQMLVDREAFKTKLGRHRLVAMLAGLFTLAQRPHDLNLRLSGDSGEISTKTPLLFVCNNPLQLEQLGLGGSRRHGPVPALSHGLMAVVLKHAGSLQLYHLALKGALGSLGEDEHLSLSTFNHLTVQPRPRWRYRTVKVALDGEVQRMRTPLFFEAVPGAISVMTPPTAESAIPPAQPAQP
ncbi:MAG: diacylglycerol kinase family protein [bacterium]|nr:diacylglycerol kinase family protein [bacterium]